MTNIRVKIATAATILGLGGLGGFAMASNPARDVQGGAPTQVAATQTGALPATPQPIVTGASGATSAAVSQATQPASTAKPAVTHTSGGGAGSVRMSPPDGDEGRVQYED